MPLADKAIYKPQRVLYNKTVTNVKIEIKTGVSRYTEMEGKRNMGILSKLFGGDKNEKSALDLLKGIVQEAVEGTGREEKPVSAAPAAPQVQVGGGSVVPTAYEEGPSGFSWGPVMPNEENQFNFNGTYIEYFETVFRENFPEYQITKELRSGTKAAVFTFRSGGETALIVELLSQGSDANRIRKQCRANGIAYLRYYYDHDGWWNTKAYVIERTRGALGA